MQDSYDASTFAIRSNHGLLQASKNAPRIIGNRNHDYSLSKSGNLSRGISVSPQSRAALMPAVVNPPILPASMPKYASSNKKPSYRVSYIICADYLLYISSKVLPSLFFHSTQPFVEPPNTKSLAPLGVLNSKIIFNTYFPSLTVMSPFCNSSSR